MASLLLVGCLGQGKRQVERLERIYGMPMHDILEKERPKQMEESRRAGGNIAIK